MHLQKNPDIDKVLNFNSLIPKFIFGYLHNFAHICMHKNMTFASNSSNWLVKILSFKNSSITLHEWQAFWKKHNFKGLGSSSRTWTLEHLGRKITRLLERQQKWHNMQELLTLEHHV